MDYGATGRLGVLTPQANTTVEPELWALLPRGWSLANARLTSEMGTIEERLVDYTTRFEATATQFANAPLSGIAAACTGASYLIGAEAEAVLADRLEERFGLPFLTSALASVAALRAMGARRIALLTPYPEGLTRASRRYWESHGFEIVASAGPAPETDAFHPIYAMTGSAVLDAWRRLSESDAEAVLMLGTGMATLGTLLAGRTDGMTPAISCNVGLVWAAVQGRSWRHLRSTDVEGWASGRTWRDRFGAMFG